MVKMMRMEIASTANVKIKEIKALLTRKGRLEQRRFIAEGQKCVEEAIRCMPELLHAVLLEKNSADMYAAIALEAEKRDAAIYIVSPSVMEAVSDVKTPQGIAAVLALPKSSIKETANFLVALEALQDPSNVGAIIRTADAAGADGVLLSPECADPYAPKALRASMGSVFHIDTEKADLIKSLERLKAQGFSIAAADLAGDDVSTFNPREKICLVIGNEGNGLSKEVLSLCSRRIRIPIYGRAESLNAAVAAGILMYKVAQQRNK